MYIHEIELRIRIRIKNLRTISQYKSFIFNIVNDLKIGVVCVLYQLFVIVLIACFNTSYIPEYKSYPCVRRTSMVNFVKFLYSGILIYSVIIGE